MLVWPAALKPGRVIRVTFSPGHPGPTRFTNYPGLTRIGSREKRNCSFDDVELINAIAYLFREPRPFIVLPTYAQPRPFISKCSM